MGPGVPKIDPSSCEFFLGGYDAEMLSIKEIILKQKYILHDNLLDWGAKLSDYGDEVKDMLPIKTAYFIELIIDHPKLLPPKYQIIDHHNEYALSCKLTSIEQIATLLKVTLEREEQLISANDKGFIRGMLNINASRDEIQRIRKKDRDAQKISEKDIILAKESVFNHCKYPDNETIIINSLTPKVTPVLELLYEQYSNESKHIIIISGSNIFYSGTGRGVLNLFKYYKELKNQDDPIQFSFGGDLPDYGYFSSNKLLPEDKMIGIIKKPLSSELFIKHDNFHG